MTIQKHLCVFRKKIDAKNTEIDRLNKLIECAFNAGIDYSRGSWSYHEGAEDIREIYDVDNDYPNFDNWKKLNGLV